MPFAEKRGNQVQNGGFEQGLSSWLGVDNVGLASGGRQHEGLIAAAMGKRDGSLPATMFQNVPACSLAAYKLQFAVSGVGPNPPELSVEVRYLNCVGADLGPALGCGPIIVQPRTLGHAGEGAYKSVVAFAEPAPPATAAARILFATCPGCEDSFLLVDDVIFVGL